MMGVSKHAMAPATLPARPSVGNGVQFGVSLTEMLSRYGVVLDQVQVEAPPGVMVSRGEKQQLVLRALQTYEHAAKKRLLNEQYLQQAPHSSHISGRHFATTVVLQNGLSAVAVNSEFSRDDVLCGERSGIVSALNRSMERMELTPLREDPDYLQKARSGLKVRWLVMSSAHRQPPPNPTDPAKDTMGSAAPCSDCQAWMATQEYFDPDTRIVSLNRQVTPGQPPAFTLRVQLLSDLFPVDLNQNLSRLTPSQISPEQLLALQKKATVLSPRLNPSQPPARRRTP